MTYEFLDSKVDLNSIVFPNSEKINPILLKNNASELNKALNFLNSDETLLNIHGFLGTGKRQFINYICDFFNKDVVKLEYYCKAATVCDDILLSFINIIEEFQAPLLTSVKISTLSMKATQYLMSLKMPFVIILHSFDDILDSNKSLVLDFLNQIKSFANVKIIISTRAMQTDLLEETKLNKVFLKALTKPNFIEFLSSNKIEATETTVDDFYKYTRGYYYYTALSIKAVNAMKLSLHDFLQKYTASGQSYDSFLASTYLNLLPNTIRNFFWFLRTVRHGLTYNALAILELYDDFSVEYLKSNLIIFVNDETIYVQDYFMQDIDILIPSKTQIKLHKYIISLYEKQLSETMRNRAIAISRQALRAEIDYHNLCIQEIESGAKPNKSNIEELTSIPETTEENSSKESNPQIDELIKTAEAFVAEKKNTEAIEEYQKILENEKIDLITLVDVRLRLARLYLLINDYHKSEHFYSLVEVYYKQHNETINLRYLYYELTDLYFKMYKHERAIETIKRVIYSVETPPSLLVSSCTLLGNIYSALNNPDDAYSYYQKALDSIDFNTSDDIKAELYFKYALANDDKNDEEKAFEYYNKCVGLKNQNPYKALAYANMGSCYFDSENYTDARDCFFKAYKIEKANNNFDGIYYSATYLAKICKKINPKKVLDFLLEAKQCAEFINEDFYILEASLALGDYYYNDVVKIEQALIEYFKARKIAQSLGNFIDMQKIENRINDMKLRMEKMNYNGIEKEYG